jgi:hypothetical protein
MFVKVLRRKGDKKVLGYLVQAYTVNTTLYGSGIHCA